MAPAVGPASVVIAEVVAGAVASARAPREVEAVADDKMIKITWFKSQIGADEFQKRTIRALGLRRLNHTVVRPDNESVRGMVATVRHLVKVEESQ